jgi:phosphate transport system protein
VANDLRLVLAVLKINYNLERIGDYANSIARLVNESDTAFDKESLKDTRISEMFTVGQGMLSDAMYAFIKEDMQAVRIVFRTDDDLDKVNKKAHKIVACLIGKRPNDVEMFLNLLAIIRKLERVGDQTKNIAEEIIFYVEAKVLRHKKKKEKLEGLE